MMSTFGLAATTGSGCPNENTLGRQSCERQRRRISRALFDCAFRLSESIERANRIRCTALSPRIDSDNCTPFGKKRLALNITRQKSEGSLPLLWPAKRYLLEGKYSVERTPGFRLDCHRNDAAPKSVIKRRREPRQHQPRSVLLEKHVERQGGVAEPHGAVGSPTLE